MHVRLELSKNRSTRQSSGTIHVFHLPLPLKIIHIGAEGGHNRRCQCMPQIPGRIKLKIVRTPPHSQFHSCKLSWSLEDWRLGGRFSCRVVVHCSLLLPTLSGLCFSRSAALSEPYSGISISLLWFLFDYRTWRRNIGCLFGLRVVVDCPGSTL